MSAAFESGNVRRKKHFKKINKELVCKVTWRGNQRQTMKLWSHFPNKNTGNNIIGVNEKERDERDVLK